MHTRDIIVVGSSMGGIEALSSLASQLPGDLPAAVLVVQHTSPDSAGLLGAILDRHGPLSTVVAEDGMPIERGRIYVAPPNRHLLATTSGLRVTLGPRENRSRPAIDPLFRTAAVNYRSRVIGVAPGSSATAPPDCSQSSAAADFRSFRHPRMRRTRTCRCERWAW